MKLSIEKQWEALSTLPLLDHKFHLLLEYFLGLWKIFVKDIGVMQK